MVHGRMAWTPVGLSKTEKLRKRERGQKVRKVLIYVLGLIVLTNGFSVFLKY